MAEGFGMIATEILIDLRKTYKQLKIIAVIPCKNQEIKWCLGQQIRYKNILSNCDEKFYISSEYSPTCMNERNLFMVKHSNTCIACWNGKPSRTGNTVRFAIQNKLTIQKIDPNNFR